MIKSSGGGLVSFELYRLLGLPDDADPDRLRRVYEEQMSAALRSSDHTRALTLSAAFDALPDNERAKVYRRLTSTSTVATSQAYPARPLRRRRPARQSVGGPRRTRPASRHIGRYLFIAVGVAAVVFLVARHQSDTTGRAAFPRGGPQAPQNLTVDSRLVSTDLDSRYGRGDVTCPGGSYQPGSTVTCQSNDGASWTVLITGPPDRFEVVDTMPSSYARSAAQDARAVVAVIARCRALTGGAVPPTIAADVTRAALTCGQSTLSVPLQAGNVLDYQRLARHAFRLTITVTDGETVHYDSRSGRYSG